MEFDRFLRYYENAADLNVRLDDRRGDRRLTTVGSSSSSPRERFTDTQGRSFNRPQNGDFDRLFVNLGLKDGFYKASFLQFILDLSDLRKEVLGRIVMKEMNSWIEVDKNVAQQMIRAIDGKNFKGRRIRMNDANSR